MLVPLLLVECRADDTELPEAVGDQCITDRDCPRGLVCASPEGEQPSCQVACYGDDPCPYFNHECYYCNKDGDRWYCEDVGGHCPPTPTDYSSVTQPRPHY